MPRRKEADMAEKETIVVLDGGVGPEREVSLRTGEAVAGALAKRFPVERVRLDEEALPAALDARDTVVFPALHGDFGEDGRLQELLDAAGFEYCGSGAAASRLCMDKSRTKAVARRLGIGVPEGRSFASGGGVSAGSLLRGIGESVIVKPADKGSSVGIRFAEGVSGLEELLGELEPGQWLLERRIRGRELTVGVLHGRAMGVVEIVSPEGVYDYAAKYSSGKTEYHCPANLPEETAERLRRGAERIFGACGCRDFARIDFLLEAGEALFLEVNTLPGLTGTSLLPMSASCEGLNFGELAAELVGPALGRFRARKGGAGA